MPMMDADFSQDYEDRPVPEGLYNLRIIKAEEKVSKNSSADMIQCILEIEGVEGASNIFHYLVMPIGSKQSAERGVEEDDSNKVRNKMRSLTRFLTLFGIKYEKKGFNTEDLIGASANNVVVIQETPEGWDSPQNSIKLPAISH